MLSPKKIQKACRSFNTFLENVVALHVSRTSALQLPRNQRANNVLTEAALFIHARLPPLRLMQTDFSSTRSQIWSSRAQALRAADSSQRAPDSAILAPTGNVGLRAMSTKMVVHISTAATTHLLSATRPPLSAPLRGNFNREQQTCQICVYGWKFIKEKWLLRHAPLCEQADCPSCSCLTKHTSAGI